MAAAEVALEAEVALVAAAAAAGQPKRQIILEKVVLKRIRHCNILASEVAVVLILTRPQPLVVDSEAV